jgi:hypothetical protein
MAAKEVSPNNWKVEHFPMLIPPTAHIAGAADAAHQIAFSQCPTEDGWQGHEALVVPITEQAIALLQSLQMFLDAGMVIQGDSSEKPQKFSLDKNTRPSSLDTGLVQ